MAKYLFYQDEIKVSYIGNSITSTYNVALSNFQNKLVNNNLITRLLIPGKIQAEDFSTQQGLETENTTDTGAGQNIGYTDAGDYAEYLIYISESGYYNLNLRTAAESSAGKIEFELSHNEVTQSISTIDLPVTGGWQSWQTTATQTTLNEGIYTLKMKVLQSGFNMNWFEFEFTSSLSTEDVIKNGVKIFPNPFTDNFNIKLNNQQIIKDLKIMDLNGRLIKNIHPTESNGVYNLSSLKSGVYLLSIETDKGSFQKKLIKD